MTKQLSEAEVRELIQTADTALDGDSNDQEHDALYEIRNALSGSLNESDYVAPEDREEQRPVFVARFAGMMSPPDQFGPDSQELTGYLLRDSNPGKYLWRLYRNAEGKSSNEHQDFLFAYLADNAESDDGPYSEREAASENCQYAFVFTKLYPSMVWLYKLDIDIWRKHLAANLWTQEAWGAEVLKD